MVSVRIVKRRGLTCKILGYGRINIKWWRMESILTIILLLRQGSEDVMYILRRSEDA
jgi:hypothetical protein